MTKAVDRKFAESLQSDSQYRIRRSADEIAAIPCTELSLSVFDLHHLLHWRILGFSTEYTRSVRKLTAT